MKESDTRIKFISDYISAYETKIKLLNSNGLFDSAKLFELFAIEVGSLFFGQRLHNLNVDTYKYPCVDLISDDKQFYVQVSTAKDLPSKIKLTLEKIRDSKRDDIKSIKNIKFMTLNNESADKVNDFQGDNRIGSISFIRKNDLITTAQILQKAMNDLTFQVELYSLLKKETESVTNNSKQLKDAMENSKALIACNIDHKLNDEYEIDRSKLLSVIKKEGRINISIQGEAGSGKSALCKALLGDVDCFVYARAEEFIEVTDINRIWGFNVRDTLIMLGERPIVFFIDALEFIADVRTRLDLLTSLYACTKSHPHAKIMTSCRLSEKKAFMKIEKAYDVHSYEVPPLTLDEIFDIGKKYPIIKKMICDGTYSDLLRIPFYLNLIVSSITDINNITDENTLREHIWRHIICLENSAVMNTVKSIVFDRARGFLLGVKSAGYATDHIKLLISKEVLIENHNRLRLKHDIFEDICFEQHFDDLFDDCKGEYAKFFNTIETFGRCAYRRYQIWISNKLLAKGNRDKFLYELIFSEKMPQKWRIQSEIGIVKSRFSEPFFIEQGHKLIEAGIFYDFLKVTNVYAFDVFQIFHSKTMSHLQLKPSGAGRKCIIRLIAENRLHEKDEESQLGIKKICSDYSNEILVDGETAGYASSILQHFIEKLITDTIPNDYYKIDDALVILLEPVYKMAKYSKEWIGEFWTKLTCFYVGDNECENRLAVDIIKDALTWKHTPLGKYLPRELCALGELFWVRQPKKKSNPRIFSSFDLEDNDEYYQYGLSKHAESHKYGGTSNESFTENNFFMSLFKNNFWMGLVWAIKFINNAVEKFYDIHPDLPECEIYFTDNEIKRKYFGYPDMWFLNTRENRLPLIISDLVYSLKRVLFATIKYSDMQDNEKIQFATNVAKTIYEGANSIILLTVIADVGMRLKDELPGFALDLITNYDIVYYDRIRGSRLEKNHTRDLLEKQIWLAVGIPGELIQDRYNDKKESKPYSLFDYILDAQIYGNMSVKTKCRRIIDYLYAIIPNDMSNAERHLQIQNMDLNTKGRIKVTEHIEALITKPTGEAQKVVEEHEKLHKPQKNIEMQVTKKIAAISKETLCLDECLEAIKLTQEAIKICPVPTEYESIMIALISNALINDQLDFKTRSEFCMTWIDGIYGYFSSKGIAYEYGLSIALFSQVEKDIPLDVKNRIKLLVLDVLTFDRNNGIINEIARIAKLYLEKNPKLAKALCNTIVKLAEDEMNRQRHNFDFLRKYNDMEGDQVFVPNTSPDLSHVESIIERDNGKQYQTVKDNIVHTFLFEEAYLDLSVFKMADYDINTICQIASCGLSLEDNEFSQLIKAIIVSIIEIWEISKKRHGSPRILDFHSIYDVTRLLQQNLLKGKKISALVLDILFENIDFSLFTRDAIEFYQNVFGCLVAEYFDGHNDRARRSNCEYIISSLESRVLAINNESVKREFYKPLIFAISRFAGSGDWTDCPSGYLYADKMFLNGMFSKYGKFHINEMMQTIYKLHMRNLLPEILLSVRDVFKHVVTKGAENFGKTRFSEEQQGFKSIVLSVITTAFFDFSDQIKEDDALTLAYEEILEILLSVNYEEAATLLDEFRIH